MYSDITKLRHVLGYASALLSSCLTVLFPTFSPLSLSLLFYSGNQPGAAAAAAAAVAVAAAAALSFSPLIE